MDDRCTANIEATIEATTLDPQWRVVEPPLFYLFTFSGNNHKELERFFEGPLPKVGDAVEMFCSESTDTLIGIKLRVVPK